MTSINDNDVKTIVNNNNDHNNNDSKTSSDDHCYDSRIIILSI